jgi:HEPN domain-containing protein
MERSKDWIDEAEGDLVHAHPSGLPRRKYTREEAVRLTDYAEEIFTFCKSLLSQI